MHLNLIQVAESLGVDEPTVMAWVRHQGLPCVWDGGRLLFDRPQVACWATEQGLAARAGFLAPATTEPSQSRAGLHAMLTRGGIWRGIRAGDVQSAFARIVSGLPDLSPEIRRMLAQRVQSADAITWAPVGNGLALPHLKSRVALGRDSGFIALLYLDERLEIRETLPDEIPVTRLLFFMAPSPRAHLEILSGLSAALARTSFGEGVRRGASDPDILDALSRPAAREGGARA